MRAQDWRFRPWGFRACGWLGTWNEERENAAMALLREMRRPLTDYELGFNAGVEASAYEAWRGCRFECLHLGGKDRRLEQKIPARIRKLKLAVRKLKEAAT